MKVGDLVRHKSTNAVGILIEILDSYWDNVYNIQWFGARSGHYNSHFIRELEVISESR